MDKECIELEPEQLLKQAKKHPHSINISTEAFSVSGRDFVLHNISLKSDPTNDYEVMNYRRGLTFLQEIVNYKEQNLRVAKKGLRKFYDLIPEYLDQKISHITNSKHFSSVRSKLIDPLKKEAETYTIYSTEKANGENAQISWDQEGQFWVIGSKNKTLLLASLKDGKYINHKFEHGRTLSIADQWFSFLEANPDKIQLIKQKLSQFVLVGEICDSVKSGHIVDYGTEVKLYFYSIISKNQRDQSCEPPSHFLQFMNQSGLASKSVKFNTVEVKSYQSLIEELRKQMYRVYEGQISVLGQGTVVYVTSCRNGIEICQTVCKVKTLQYRIFRKLREKLKVYFEKFRKNYDKLLHKYIEQVKQLTKGFHLPQPEQYYFHIAKRAFEFTEDQQKAVSKFFHNKFISFLKLLQYDRIDKEEFKKIVHQDIGNEEISQLLQKQEKEEIKQIQLKQEQQKNVEQKNISKQIQIKKVIVLIPMTIPATGKSTLFNKMISTLDKFVYTEILSSDTIRAVKMSQLMKRQKNITKQAAFDKTRQSANNQFYKQLNQILKRMSLAKQYNKCLLIVDKNHPQNALKKTTEQIGRGAQKFKNISVQIICVLPKCQQLLMNKPKFIYPFSSCYIACCLKRVASRQQHETLSGSPLKRCNVVLGFANMFRNFSISNYNLSKYFNGVITLPFTIQQQQIPQQIQAGILKIMLGTKPGSFDQHPTLQQLFQLIKNWKIQQFPINKQLDHFIQNTINNLFQQFQNIKVDVLSLGIEGVDK